MKTRQILFLILVVFSVISCSFDSGGSSHKKEQFRISVVPEYSLNEETDEGRWAASFLAPTLPAIASYRLRIFPAGNSTTEVYSTVWNSGDPVPADIILDYGSYDFQLWGYDAPNAGGNIIAYGNNPYTTNPAQTTVPLYLYSTYGQFPGCSGSGNATLIFDYSASDLFLIRDNYDSCVARVIDGDGTETTLATGDFTETASSLELDMTGWDSGIYRITLYMLDEFSDLVAGVCDYVFIVYDDVTITYRATAQTTDLPPLMAPVSSVSLVYDETGGLVLSWDDNCLFEENYVLTKVVNMVFTDIVLPAGTESYTDPDVSAHLSYNYNIRAVSSLYGSSSGTASTSLKPKPVFYIDPLNGDDTTINCHRDRPWRTLQALINYINFNEGFFANPEPITIYLMNRPSFPYLMNSAFTVNYSRSVKIIGTDTNWEVPTEAGRPEVRYTGLPSAIPSAAVFVQTPCTLQHLYLNGGSGIAGVSVDSTVPDSFVMSNCTVRGGTNASDFSYGLLIERAANRLVIADSRIEAAQSPNFSSGIFFNSGYGGQAEITGCRITGNTENSGTVPPFSYGINNDSPLNTGSMIVAGCYINGGFSTGNTYGIYSDYPNTIILNSTVYSGENFTGNQDFGISLSDTATYSYIDSCILSGPENSANPFIGVSANSAICGTNTDDLNLKNNVYDLDNLTDPSEGAVSWGGYLTTQDQIRVLESSAGSHVSNNYIIPLVLDSETGRIQGVVPRVVANGGVDNSYTAAFLPDGSIGTRTTPFSIGAHEYDSGILGGSGTLTVDTESGSDVLDENYGTGQLTLHEALYLANLTDSSATDVDYDRIEFAPSVNTISPASTLRVTTPDLTIFGGTGEPGVTLDGGDSIRIMDIDDGTPGTASFIVSLEGLTFINGFSDRGGALYISESGILLESCHFLQNSVAGNTNPLYGGGAIFDYNGSIGIKRCVFEANIAEQYGGAIRFYSDSSGGVSDMVVTIDNSLFLGNSTTNWESAYGGTLALYADDRDIANYIYFNVFDGNDTYDSHGKDVYLLGNSATVENFTFHNTFLGRSSHDSFFFIGPNADSQFYYNIVWNDVPNSIFFFTNGVNTRARGSLNVIGNDAGSVLEMSIAHDPLFNDPANPYNGTLFDRSDDGLYPQPSSPALNMVFDNTVTEGDHYLDAGAYNYDFGSNPVSGLSLSGILEPGGEVLQASVQDSLLAVAAGSAGLFIYDISDPGNLVLEHVYRPDGGTSPVTQVKWNKRNDNGLIVALVFIENGSNSRIESLDIMSAGSLELTAADVIGLPQNGLAAETQFDVGYNQLGITSPGGFVQTRDIHVSGTMVGGSNSLVGVGDVVSVVDNYVFLGTANWSSTDIEIRDVSDLSISYTPETGIYGGAKLGFMNLQGGYLFTSADYSTLLRYDASSPSSLSGLNYDNITGISSLGRIRDSYIFGDFLLLADLDNGLRIYDISAGSSAISVSHNLLPAGISLYDIDMDTRGTIYCAAGTDGLYILRP